MHAKSVPRNSEITFQNNPPTGPLLGGYLTPAQLATELGITVKTLKRWRDLGKGPPVTFVGRFPYYSPHGRVAWLRSREQAAS
jgi:hypothetical protein